MQSQLSFRGRIDGIKVATGGMHRWFHPLCGSHPVTLLTLHAQNGSPSLHGLLPTTIALMSSLLRSPFTAAELAWTA